MVGKTRPISELDAKRMDTISEYCGCLPCLLMGLPDVHTTIEHATSRGRRLEDEHQWTIGLCEWHHFGHPWIGSGFTGPSLANGRKPFEEHFGDEVKVLVPTQDFMLREFEELPWPEYSVPRRVARDVKTEWTRLCHATTRLSSNGDQSG